VRECFFPLRLILEIHCIERDCRLICPQLLRLEERAKYISIGTSRIAVLTRQHVNSTYISKKHLSDECEALITWGAFVMAIMASPDKHDRKY
jgi:hypothetical protein